MRVVGSGRRWQAEEGSRVTGRRRCHVAQGAREGEPRAKGWTTGGQSRGGGRRRWAEGTRVAEPSVGRRRHCTVLPHMKLGRESHGRRAGSSDQGWAKAQVGGGDAQGAMEGEPQAEGRTVGAGAGGGRRRGQEEAARRELGVKEEPTDATWAYHMGTPWC